MPEPYWPKYQNPDAMTLEQAAALHYLVTYKCGCCHRLVRFLAEDLSRLYGPLNLALEPLFPCGKCKSWDYLRVDVVAPREGDFGHLEVRRPGRVRIIQPWKTVKLGDEMK